ncbi:MAG: hypothetical protein HOQ05_12085 [Corynebacteriales bacterium]|nr:hypothetical protein [Mycobacteriales bacterium]
MPFSEPAPRWANIAAHVAALTPLPSSLWRLSLAFGYPGGYTAEGFTALNLQGWGITWVVFLSLITEFAALLTLGLVRPWGRTVPHWIPLIGDTVLNPRIIAATALTGALILFALWTPFLFWWGIEHPDMTSTGHIFVGLAYVPLVAWAPLLLAVTVNYYQRERHYSNGRRATGGMCSAA